MEVTQNNQADLLARYLPDGEAWQEKWIDGSILRNLLIALGKEFDNIEQRNEWLRRELNPFTAVDLLDNWEEEYGIPDEVFTIEGKSIDDRHLNIYIKEIMEGADRVENWELIASKFGFKCKVYPAIEVARFPLIFPIRFIDMPRYTIMVDLYDVSQPAEFPVRFPIKFGENKATLIKKVFEIIKPSDCSIMYNYL